MAARPLAFPQPQGFAGGCQGTLDLPIMAARRGCRAEVTAARRGGRGGGGRDLKGQCPPSGGGGGGCGGRGTGTESGSGGSGSNGRTEEESYEPRHPAGGTASLIYNASLSQPSN
ncbi:hypothetical protein MC885_017018 [Smutsia gigantea]|nr:hypothetical protein MC885_017018 [Smutsia gigantea]